MLDDIFLLQYWDDIGNIGEMTVRETLAFSARCQVVGIRYDMLTELSRREREANIKPDPDIDVYMKAISMEGKGIVVTDYILKSQSSERCSSNSTTQIQTHMQTQLEEMARQYAEQLKKHDEEMTAQRELTMKHEEEMAKQRRELQSLYEMFNRRFGDSAPPPQ